MSTPGSASSASDSGDWCPPTPDQAEPQDRRQLGVSECDTSALLHLGMRPLLLTGLFIDLVRRHFSVSRYVQDPQLKHGGKDNRGTIWRAGPTTGIMIESMYAWKADMVDKRPAILIKRGSYKNLRVTIKDHAVDDQRGNPHFQTLWVGSHTLFCVSQSASACEILAEETRRELTQFGPVICRDLRLHRYQVMEVGQLAVVEESAQHFVVPVTIGWAYEEKWMLEPERMTLMGFSLNA